MKSLLLGLFSILFAGSSWAIEKADFLPVAREMMGFPGKPNEAAFRSIETKIEALPSFAGDKDERHLTLICATFLAAAHQRHGWALKGTSPPSKTAAEIVSGQGATATYVSDDDNVDASKFDVWWMSYLGSQDDKYLHKLLKYAGSPKPENDPLKAALIKTATWSFQSNCQHVPGVKEFAERCLKDPAYKDKADFLRGCVEGK